MHKRDSLEPVAKTPTIQRLRAARFPVLQSGFPLDPRTLVQRTVPFIRVLNLALLTQMTVTYAVTHHKSEEHVGPMAKQPREKGKQAIDAMKTT